MGIVRVMVWKGLWIVGKMYGCMIWGLWVFIVFWVVCYVCWFRGGDV